MLIGIAMMENSMKSPLKTKNRATIWYRNPIPGHLSRENHDAEGHMHPGVHFRTIYNRQDMEATYMSMDRWVDKEDVVHIYNGILLSHNKKCKNAIYSNMNRPRDCHPEWSESDKERQISVILLMGGILKKLLQMNLFT